MSKNAINCNLSLTTQIFKILKCLKRHNSILFFTTIRLIETKIFYRRMRCKEAYNKNRQFYKSLRITQTVYYS